MFDYARKNFASHTTGRSGNSTMSQELSGNLTIGTQNSIGLFLISPIVGLFLKHNSKLNIKLVYGTPESIREEMKGGSVDIAILPDAQMEFGETMDQYAKFLLKDEMWLVGTGKDPSLPKTISMSEFTQRPIIYYSEMYNSFKSQLDKKLEETQAQFIPVFEADNVGTLKRVIESGLGWGFLPSFSIRKQVRTGRLSHIMVDDLMFSININLYSKKTAASRKMSEGSTELTNLSANLIHSLGAVDGH
ncbi:MAG: LysR family transcriptional regulator substrate-binding protein [Bdellovibrionales bacterium]